MEKQVTLQSEGKLLKGTLHLPDSWTGPLPFVILFHGFCDERNEINFVHTELSRRLLENGIGSVRFDFNGSGESEGRFEDMTISSEVQDALNIIDWSLAQPFVDPNRLALHGLSLGGCVASMAAGLRNEQICALSLWCPAPDVVYNLQKHQTLCGIDASDVEEKRCIDVEGLKVGYGFYEDALKLDPFETASHFHKNVNLVHGDADITASVDCSKRYKEIFGDKANLLIVPGAEHRFTSFDFRKARMDSALNFLRQELLEKERENG